MDLLLKRLMGLLCIKSLITVILTLLFVHLAAHGQVPADDFITIFTMVIAFHFGAESDRRSMD